MSKPKPPVILDAKFRMSVEKIMQHFLSDPIRTSVEFPATLSSDERNFINEFAYKIGLKSKNSRNGKNNCIVIYKTDQIIATADSALQLCSRSKKTLRMILELLPEEEDNMRNSSNPTSIFDSRSYQIIQTIPPMNFNPECLGSRRQLPIFEHRREILEMINNNQVLIIESTTGSGKSTQVPQYLLEEATERHGKCRIIVAEPKRICAIALAERVSYERGEQVGRTVGYQIRLESKVGPSSSLIFVTNGVILRMLMRGNPGEFFEGVTALIIDEVHERDKFSDFLLLCIREYLPQFPHLKLIIMSATIPVSIFTRYFGNCPSFKLEGRAHHVKEEFLEDVLVTLKFKNDRVRELQKKYQEDPESIDNPKKNMKSVENLDDDTKEMIEQLMTHMSRATDCEFHFCQFFYMVTAENVPVDIRHIASNRTALMFAVEHDLDEIVLKLLNMSADPTLTINDDGREINALDIAIGNDNVKMAEMISNCIELMSRPPQAPDDVNHICSSPYNRKMMDIYYDRLAEPGVNRGVFLDDVVDIDLIVKLVRYIHFKEDHSNAILIFLPGHDEIVQLSNQLCNSLDNNFSLFILHSQMRTMDQSSVFDKIQAGRRKIILATNIAESSITVDDVVFVIDSGKEKKKEFNAATQISSLRPQWISKASAKQRMGRAGRLRDGVVYRLYSRDRYSFMSENPKPEFLRDDLSELCLQARILAKPNETIAEFMSKAISPPNELNIKFCVEQLESLGALSKSSRSELTMLGAHLADIPVDSKYGKMLLHAIFFKCLDPILNIVCTLSVSDPFTLSHRNEDRVRLSRLKTKLQGKSFSDHYVMHQIYKEWCEYKAECGCDEKFCADNFVNSRTLERIESTRVKLISYMRRVGFVQSNVEKFNKNSSNWSVVRFCIAAGSYPHVARIVKQRGAITTSVDEKITINPGSVLHSPSLSKPTGKQHLADFPTNWMVFDEKNLGGVFAMAKNCSLVTDTCIALTAGQEIRINEDVWADDEEPDEVILQADNFIKFAVTPVEAQSLLTLRHKLDQIFSRFLANISNFRFSESDEVLVAAVIAILKLEDEKAGLNANKDGTGKQLKKPTEYQPRTEDFPSMNGAQEEATSETAGDKMNGAQEEATSETAAETRDAQEVATNGAAAETTLAQEEKKIVPDPSTVSPIRFSPKVIKSLKTKPTNTMRYFIMEIQEEICQRMISKVCTQAKLWLPVELLDELIESEVSDRISKKVILFRCGYEIIGTALLMDCREKQITRENMKLFCQCKQKVDLKSIALPETFERLFQTPFAKVPKDIGMLCANNCLAMI